MKSCGLFMDCGKRRHRLQATVGTRATPPRAFPQVQNPDDSFHFPAAILLTVITHPCNTNPMLIRIGYDIIFDLPAPTPMHLLLYVHPSRLNRLREPEVLTI